MTGNSVVLHFFQQHYLTSNAVVQIFQFDNFFSSCFAFISVLPILNGSLKSSKWQSNNCCFTNIQTVHIYIIHIYLHHIYTVLLLCTILYTVQCYIQASCVSIIN